jgi:hypothetical protein
MMCFHLGLVPDSKIMGFIVFVVALHDIAVMWAEQSVLVRSHLRSALVVSKLDVFPVFSKHRWLGDKAQLRGGYGRYRRAKVRSSWLVSYRRQPSLHYLYRS